ncbi:MAG: hypothetical protein NUV54_01830 [Candidatus Taylorbacteria bacterium]|nr:hypothetical protein [Candidatus Taylorbacteria bacterium]
MTPSNKNLLKNTHHAYCLTGNAEVARTKLYETLQNEWGIVASGNPDFSHTVYNSLGVDEAREIANAERTNPFRSGKRIFVIEAQLITNEAQNALLKLLEEPKEATHFFLIGNATAQLLPTLLSRVSVINIDEKPTDTSEEILTFLTNSQAERIETVKKLTDDIKNEKRTKADALSLLRGVENELYKRAKSVGVLDEKLFADLERCRGYLSDRSAGVKMILEYVALIVPVDTTR